MHERVRERAEGRGTAEAVNAPQMQPKRQNLSLSKLREEVKRRPRKIELEKFEYSPENVRIAWDNLKGLVRNRIPLFYRAIEAQNVNVLERGHVVIIFTHEGALNAFNDFRARAESYFRQVFSFEEFTVEGTLDLSILTSLDPSMLSMSDFCTYLQQKNEAVGDLFDAFKLSAQ